MKQRAIMVAGVVAGVIVLPGLTGLAYAAQLRQKRGEDKPQAAAPGASARALLSRAEREAIVKAAVTAAHESVQIDVRKRNGDRISRGSWGEAIQKLHPLRVVNDSMNVMIVMTEDSHNEKGFYISNPISSYLVASNDPRFAAFERLSKPEDKSFGSLFFYCIRKK